MSQARARDCHCDARRPLPSACHVHRLEFVQDDQPVSGWGVGVHDWVRFWCGRQLGGIHRPGGASKDATSKLRWTGENSKPRIAQEETQRNRRVGTCQTLCCAGDSCTFAEEENLQTNPKDPTSKLRLARDSCTRYRENSAALGNRKDATFKLRWAGDSCTRCKEKRAAMGTRRPTRASASETLPRASASLPLPTEFSTAYV